jgi:hypothetical protein
VNGIIMGINWVIRKLNVLGKFTIPGLTLFGQKLWDDTPVKIFEIQELALLQYAKGGFPANGEMFIANEAGPELVGTMDGKTAVANQEQIVEGIRRGVYDAQSEQNALLRRQNELLTAILRKDASVRIGASSMLGRTVRQSLDMYEAAAGV